MAAEALVEWVHARRATWTTEPLDAGERIDFSELSGIVAEEAPSWSPPAADPSPFPSTPPPTFADLQPVVAAIQPPPPASAAAIEIEEAFDAEPPVREEQKPRLQLQVAIGAIRSFASPLVPVARRAAPFVAALALLMVVGKIATPYVGKMKTWATDLTDETTETKAEPVAAPKPAKKGTRTGELTARSEPPGAKVLIDGRERGVTPLTLDNVTIGSHTVVLQSEKGSVRRTVTVTDDRPVIVSETIFAGWLTVFAPFEVQITEGTHVIRLDDNGKALLPPGPHDLKLENRDLGFQETRRVDVQPGQTTSLSLVTPPSTLSVTASTPASVSIDGKQVGETPMTNQPIALGTRDIVVKTADGAERRFTTKVTVAPVQIDVDFSKP